MEQLIKKMAQDNVWQSWVAANSAGSDPRTAKNGCISAAAVSDRPQRIGCISAAPKRGCIS
ncbi:MULTISPECIES: hypothetical protein [Streptomyces]|uniref:Uncharacterized protein n=2 Tax=Streptomyces TaxID=1883 RepID=A0A2N8PJ22_STRNR|nr:MULTISPECIES: hypothetical protein [Streptomyces]PNE41035.1 hypothetical protein AOB60_09870 [Streptomyces noursei]SHN11649.1 hypothetical protein SAMN05216268_12015 [Streptomyces yunnanensis]